jgi:RHS repeat-associated protein
MGAVGNAWMLANAAPAASNAATSGVQESQRGLSITASPTSEEIFRARVFEEPLVPVGGEPSAEETAALAAALVGYARRSGPDDFSSLTAFLEQHPASVWRAALLTGLGLEYYNTAHYSLALQAWNEAWAAGQNATTAQAKAIADRAGGELAYMYGRLGRMGELEVLLQSVAGRTFSGPGNLKIIGAQEGLWMMKNQPEIAFFCGPQALNCIKLAVDPSHPAMEIIRNAASTQRGCSLPYVAELSRKIGLNYQMAFREKGSPFIVPSVVHWKVGHYAALIGQAGDLYLLKDPTFRNDTWATRQALEDETSGYFLVPPGPLPRGWRAVEPGEGDTVWGKGSVNVQDPGGQTPRDLHTGPQVCQGMMVPRVHLMTVNLSLVDQPVGYAPPVGPAVAFTVRFNSLDGFQPANEAYSNFGPQWSCDWISYLTDSPSNSLADVSYFIGGGQRTFTFDTNTQAFAYQQYDQTLLTRTATNPVSYTMTWPDGSQMLFSDSDGSVGTSRRIFLTQVIDPQGNAVTLTYDGLLRLVAITDAIGQVTTITHGLPLAGTGTVGACTGTNTVAADPYKITRITDPFGRSATFDYTVGPIGFFTCTNAAHQMPTNFIYAYLLNKITDVNGLTSQVDDGLGTIVVGYSTTNGLLYVTNYTSIGSLTTPYGTSRFSLSYGNGVNRVAEITYPDGSRDRVEFNQSNSVGVPDSDPGASVPRGMNTFNANLYARNTYYWSRNACALAYGDYTKARIYHWLHTLGGAVSSGILESTKAPLEARVWYDYAGQSDSLRVGDSNRPRHSGRVLDDGSTQLYTYAYNGFGRVTNMLDPAGRTFSYDYATNGNDLVAIRQTRAGNNELLFKATYNSQHRPLTRIDAAGQTNTFTYNARGQLVSATNPKGETLTLTYDANGYLIALDGPLPGTSDTVTTTYDFFGRPQTLTDVSGYTVIFDYDALDRLTRVTYPDGTFDQYTYDRLDLAAVRDRAGRVTSFEHNNLRQLDKLTDPLGRVTLFDWCRCGALRSLTDPLGRKTSWLTDVQGRPIGKQYADGSLVNYTYENTTSRLRQVVDERFQITGFAYNPDNTFRSIGYANASVPTPGVSFTYDPDYERVISVTDGTGTTRYAYNPITGAPALGAGRLASVDGPLANDTITYTYDELGRRISSAINGVASTMSFDAAGRPVNATNLLGQFAFAYDGSSRRIVSESFPNGQTAAVSYGGAVQDFLPQQISFAVGATPISQSVYGRDVSRGRITTWSQQAGAQPPSIFNFGYDAANQLLSATVTNAGTLLNTFAYGYDLAGNRLSEQVGVANYAATYNALNQLSTTTAPGGSRTNEWDAAHRLVAVNAGNQRTEFTYDGQSHVVGIRQLLNSGEVSHRLLVWNGDRLREERDTNGVVTKRFFSQGVRIETGTNAGNYYYTRDHLGSIRELTDASGNVRARYAYDPFGRRTKVSGGVDADFGFAGMFWAAEVNLSLTHFRAYDPDLGRWLSRDPLKNAEMNEGPNLYAYVRNEPISRTDPAGLCLGSSICACFNNPVAAAQCGEAGIISAGGAGAVVLAEENAPAIEAEGAAAIQAVGPALQQCAARVAQVFDTVEPRIAALEASYPAAEAEIPLFRELTVTRASYLRTWLADMIHVDRDFFEISELLAAKLGISFDQAWKLLAERVGFDPESW